MQDFEACVYTVLLSLVYSLWRARPALKEVYSRVGYKGCRILRHEILSVIY